MFELALVPTLLLVLGGLVAGFLNVIAGGGSLITMPLLIFLGLPPTSAVGTIRLAILVQSMTASYRYHRAGSIDWKAVLPLVLPVCLGTVAGALVASNMADTDFRSLLGWITLAAGALVVVDLNKYLNREARAPGRMRRLLTMLAILVVGFYAGLVQAGAGYLFLASLVFGAQLSLVQANVVKAVLVLCLTPITLVIFGLNDQIHLGYALALTLGQAVGAYVGAQFNLRQGARWIRPILAIAVVAAAVKLLL